ncbi:MAG: hypothetical protein JSS49_07145 [Planctomycetes bacterium]|nr:hypothetical protein [Planctomycetota bacterium]
MKTLMVALAFVLSLQGFCLAADDAEIKALRQQVEELKERVKTLEQALAPVMEQQLTAQRVRQQQVKARERMSKDTEIYSRAQIREIESLYQVANQKWQTEEGKNSLKELIKKYDKANRTGCATLYLGQMSEGAEKEEFLNKAIADFSDCWYGDGVQVGAFARYILADYYRGANQSEKADELFKQLNQQYPDAIDHSGKLLAGPQ